ncbi:hypothetical protein AB4166_11360 [Vibrio splendidus]
MIKINLEKKIAESNYTISTFRSEYLKSIRDCKLTIITGKNTALKDRFGLYPGKDNAELLVIKSNIKNQLTIDEVFYECYKNNLTLRQFIDRKFNHSPIRNKLGAKLIVNTIILSSPEKLEEYCTTIPTPNPIKDLIYNIFNYDKFGKYNTSPKKTMRDVIASLNFKVCVYCNRNYTSNFSDKHKAHPTFTLDHFYQKDIHPLFALSVYNLIPSCSVCNTTIKGSRNLEHYKNPYSKTYRFHELSKFKLYPNFKVNLESTSQDCRQYIKDFKINEIYQCHDKEVKDIVIKGQKFNRHVIQNIAEFTGDSPEKIKDVIFGSYRTSLEIGEESLAKLKYDLVRELGIY